MFRLKQKIAALVVLGVAGIGIGSPSCTSRLGPVRATQNVGGLDLANLADITVERARECMERDGRSLEAGRTELLANVELNENGDKTGMTLQGVPESAPDFSACLRNVLRDLPLPEQPFREAVERLHFYRQHANDSQIALERFLEGISGVPIVKSELFLEVDDYTVVLSVTVNVRSELENLVDLDKKTLAKIGQMALDSLGYDEIMKRAEDLGWVKWVPIEQQQEQSQLTANKQFIGDVSPSPATPSPARLPPPPPPSVITKTVTKRVVTRAAPKVVTKVLPAAAAAAAADGPLPFGDIIAVGSVVVALIIERSLEPEEVLVLGGGQARRLTAAASAAAATTSAPQPAATVAKPRKYPNQTCEDEEMARLEKEMHENFCDKGYAASCGGSVNKKDLPLIPCSAIKLSVQQRQACLAARWKVQNECFGGKPDKEHKDEIDNVQRGIDRCEALKLKNCAKGHPMADL